MNAAEGTDKFQCHETADDANADADTSNSRRQVAAASFGMVPIVQVRAC